MHNNEMPERDIKQARLAAIEKLRNSSVKRQSGPTPTDPEAIQPLSLAQETLWLVDKLSPGRATYNVPLALRLLGAIDIEALKQALRVVIQRHDAFQMYVLDDADGCYQQYSSYIDAISVRTISSDDDPVALLEEEAAIGFSLTEPPLWRATILQTGETTYLLLNVHHIIFDGWSSALLQNQLFEAYTAILENRNSKVGRPRLQYRDFAHWQRQKLTSGGFDEDISYWKRYLADLPSTSVATDYPLPPEVTFSGKTIAKSFPGLSARANTLAKSLSVSSYAIYSTALAAVLDRFSQNDEVIFAIPAANRHHVDLEDVIGFFVNILPIRIRTAGSDSFSQVASIVHKDIREAVARSEVPYAAIVDAVNPPRDPSKQPLFQIGLSVKEWSSTSIQNGIEVAEVRLHSGTARYQLSFVVEPHDDDATISLEYNTDLFGLETAESLINSLAAAIISGVDSPRTILRQLDLLHNERRDQETANGIGPAAERRTELVTDAYRRTLRAHPNRVAVVDSQKEWTYLELEEKVQTIADHLTSVIHRPHGAHVAVLVERNIDLPATILAILRIGAVYVPIDPGNPPERVKELLADSGASLLAGSDHLVDSYKDVVPYLAVDQIEVHAAQTPPFEALTKPESPAYIMYTSGSTGKPKGVIVSHSNVVNFIQNTITLFEIAPDDKILGYASAGFDVSIFEIFGALLTGASVHFVPTERRLDVEFVQSFIAKSGITITDIPPSVMSLLDPEHFESLRIVFVGGEPFSSELVDRWAPNRRFFNGYGPTECTVTMIIHECAAGQYKSTPPIGLPMGNHVAHVIDSSGSMAPQGAVGDLYVGGTGLAIGYHNREEANQAFVVDWLNTTADGRLYRTGDLARRNADGNLVYMGRRDNQVKINGVRIELGEIEWAMRTHPSISQAHAAVVEQQPQGKVLVAYYTSANHVDERRLLAHLKERLVPAMVPRGFVRLDSMPLTPNGKVNKKLLPTPSVEPESADNDFVSETEHLLAQDFYAPLLGSDSVSRRADFFESGGASLQAAQLISRIRQTFDVELPLSRFFGESSIESVALYIDRELLSRLSPAELEERLDAMDDSEIDRLLQDDDESAGAE